jgi:Ca2+-binding EF-hand superfamily protein
MQFGPLLLLALAIVVSSIAVQAADTKAKAPASSFEGMDADRDGRISADEHRAAAEKMFKTMDANGDGKVTAAEMTAAQKKITGKAAAKGDMSAADKIKAIDTDRDGVLTAA